MSKERFEVFGNIIKDNEQMPNLLDNYQATIRLNEFTQRIAELKQQLAEKDKEIARLKLLVDGFDKLKQYDRDADLILINPKTCYTDGKELIIKSDNQDKISFAVEQLEKVLVLIHNAVNIYSPEYDLVGLYDAVSNQIKQLKEKK